MTALVPAQLLSLALRQRLLPVLVHLLGSLLIALTAAGLVFGLWYPEPYRQIAGGQELFMLLVTVDVVVGPLITLVVFDRRKPRTELRRDMAVVVLLQLAALGYGIWTLAAARPVHLVFELDRFRVVHAIDVPPELLPQAPESLRTLPWTGPTPMSLRPFRSDKEKFEATMAALGGVSLAARPDLWQDYEAGRVALLREAQPLGRLRERFPAQASEIDSAVARSGRPEPALAWLPLAARKSFWTVLVDRSSAEIVGFLPIDSF
ncbi:TfpX/TfpZ family type IV pilin accessory protein [Ramlibacter tataouinensis]|uniref:TfpX/TfpZ family type IV pilin accessory protein n=1 Tax=Ramlibacter tataouinensis TaxID=94132 RepID=UPI0022F3EBB9|nr:TfpX/TfpZ family type IV pilin accessory protein [Ramlibacter tataouinensis]WBY00109.1 TfpX/TfpZ family type IV pilin accessory protein [Ramlibacter tataouinensis]